MRVRLHQNTCDLAKWSYITTEAISTIEKVPARHTERPPRTTKHADNTRTDRARRVRPPNAPPTCLRRHVLRPSTGGARPGAGAHGRRAPAMPRPPSGARPGALGSPRRGHGARVAHGRGLRPGAGAGGPEHVVAAGQLAPPPASCSAALHEHGRLARSEALGRRRLVHGTQSSSRSSCTCGAARCKLRTAAAGEVLMSRRRGQGWGGHGGLDRPTFCTCLRMPMQGSRSHPRREPARTLGLAADAAMFASRPLLLLSTAV